MLFSVNVIFLCEIGPIQYIFSQHGGDYWLCALELGHLQLQYWVRSRAFPAVYGLGSDVSRYIYEGHYLYVLSGYTQCWHRTQCISHEIGTWFALCRLVFWLNTQQLYPDPVYSYFSIIRSIFHPPQRKWTFRMASVLIEAHLNAQKISLIHTVFVH